MGRRRLVVIEMYHLTVLVPRGLPQAEQDAALRTLIDAVFEARLRPAARRVFRVEPSLAKAKVRLSR